MLLTATTGAWAQEPTKYKVTLQEGTEDADKWEVPAEAAEGATVTATYSGDKKVKSVKAVKKAGYLKWDKGQEKLVETAIPTTANKVQNSDQNVEWAGTYVVEGDVTISGEIKLTGDVELIIKDGATLTVTKLIHTQSGASLSVYGQTQMSGELNVTNSGSDAIMRITTLEVHSCKVKATSPAGGGGGVYLITTLNVYGGSLDAEHTGEGNGYGILLKAGGSMNIYGGEVKAVGKGNNADYSYGIKSSKSSEVANVKVYGGKLWAECATNKAFRQINLTTEAGYTGKIQYSSDKSTWSKIADADAKYVRVEPADNTYLKWDADQKKLVKTDIQAPYTTVTSSTTTWPAGTYVVEDDVTISGTITLTGDVELIIKDAKLTVNQITGGSNKYNLSIYGQANQTGQLVVNKSDDTAIKDITKLEVHSAKVKATSSEGYCGGLYDIKTINVYGGSVDAENTGDYGSGIKLPLGGSMNIYGGDVKVVGKGNFSGIGSGSATTVTVDGGKLWAENASFKAINTTYVTLTTSSKIETSSDGNGWTEYTQASTPSAEYVRVGY